MTSTEKSGTDADKVMSMNLLVDTKSNRVLYAEAGKDVVDFLFLLLTLPLGRADRLLRTVDGSVGSIGNLYASVEGLEAKYICLANAKDALLTPAGLCESGKLVELLNAMAPAVTTQIFWCSSNLSSYPSCRNYVTMASGTPCGYCGAKMTTPLNLVGPIGGGVTPAVAAAGFVQQIVTYTVMDDLKVSHTPTISGITLLNTFGITDIRSLQEKTVQLGYAEVNCASLNMNQLIVIKIASLMGAHSFCNCVEFCRV
jgi:hypothetical protein